MLFDQVLTQSAALSAGEFEVIEANHGFSVCLTSTALESVFRTALIVFHPSIHSPKYESIFPTQAF
jgi:hypothetical protein